MTRLLLINSSPNREWSISRRMTECFLESYSSAAAAVEVVERDVGAQPPPHLNDSAIEAYFARTQLTEQQKTAVALSDELVDEFLSADIIVIGAPMHNFGVTSGLKAYVDHIVRAGRTFMFSPAGPIGLATGKSYTC